MTRPAHNLVVDNGRDLFTNQNRGRVNLETVLEVRRSVQPTKHVNSVSALASTHLV
jgi:hypothetical protein